MGVAEADQLEKIIENADKWPVWSTDFVGGRDTGAAPQIGMYGRSARELEKYVAIRESDREHLASLIGWDAERAQGEPKREYKVDPLGERISQAFSDLLFGEDPEWKAANEADEEILTEMINANDLPSELRTAAADASSEGEIWWRLYVDPDESEFPVIEFVSRLDVIPLFRGRKIVAAAFVTVLLTQEIKVEEQTTVEYWRHIEIQTDGETRNLLYKGALGQLGSKQPLEANSEVSDLEDKWDHNLKYMLCGRVLNKRGRDFRLGISDYQGILDLLLDLNEVRVIMAENARLSGKSRMVVPANAVGPDGKVSLGKDIIVDEGVEDFGDGGRAGAYAVLEYTFQANELIAYKNDLVSDAMTRVGLAEQFMGGGKSSNEGSAMSGTALRTRLIPTTLAGSGKGRYWDAETPRIATAMQEVDALPVKLGGCGHTWTNPSDPPTIERSSVLPEDPREQLDLEVTAVSGEVRSVETAVRKLNPDWDDEQIEKELAQIKADRGEFGIGGKNAGEAEQEGQAAEGDE